MIEMIVACAMAVIITGAAVSMFVSAIRQQPSNTKNADLIGDARNATEVITADVRQASKAVPSGRTGVTLTTFCDKSGGTVESCTIVYACAKEGTTTSYKCTRKVGSEAATTIASKLASGSIFCYVPSTTAPACGETSGTSPSYVGLALEYRNVGERSVTVLEDGAALHNSSTYKGS